MVNQGVVDHPLTAKHINTYLCSIISLSEVENFNMVDCAYLALIIRFHHCVELRDHLVSKNVLPASLFSGFQSRWECHCFYIKAKLNSIIPRGINRECLQKNIKNVIVQLGNFNEYHRHFWEKVNSSNNIQLE